LGGFLIASLTERFAVSHVSTQEIARLVNAEDSLQLLDRRHVILDAEIDVAGAVLGIAIARTDHEKCGWLHSARIAAGSLAGMKRGDEPFGEFALRSVECRDDVRDDILADEDVSLHGEVRFGHMAGPRQRLRAGPCGGAPRRVDDAELAVIAPFVRSGSMSSVVCAS
jgi:hypothetical protein